MKKQYLTNSKRPKFSQLRISKLIATIFTTIIIIQGCNPFETMYDKQVKACIVEIKKGLGDPESLELISTEGIYVKERSIENPSTFVNNGWFRTQVDYTYKNAMGGRVRGSDTCGYTSKDEIAFNPRDDVNSSRELRMKMKELGININ